MNKTHTFSEALFNRNQYALLKQAVEQLSDVCDGALNKDNRGFDGTDTRAGHLYAFLPIDAWPLCVFHRAWRWTKKYHRQLEAMDINCSQLPEPPRFENEERQIALWPEGQGYYVIFPNDAWDLIDTFRSLAGSAVHKVPIGISETLFFRYRTYQGPEDVLLSFAAQNRFRLGPGVQECAQMPDESRAIFSGNRVVYEQSSDSFALYFFDRLLNAEVKHIPYRSHSYDGGFHWIIAAQRAAVGPLRIFLTRHDFFIPADAEQRLQELEGAVSRTDLYR